MMHVCLSSIPTRLNVVQILDGNQISYSSIHKQQKLIPIQVKYIKVLSSDYLLTSDGVTRLNGDLVIKGSFLDAIQYENAFILMQANRLILWEESQFEVLISGQIYGIQLQEYKLIVDSQYYHLINLITRHITQIGTIEKHKQYGAVIHQSYIYCGRPNSILWKAKLSGEVTNSYKFKNIKFSYLGIVRDHLINVHKSCICLINIETMNVIKKIEVEFTCFEILSDCAYFYYKKTIHKLRLLPDQEAFDFYISIKNSEAETLFLSQQCLQTKENALILNRAIKCCQAKSIIQNLTKRIITLQNPIKPVIIQEKIFVDPIMTIKIVPSKKKFEIYQQPLNVKQVEELIKRKSGVKQLAQLCNMKVKELFTLDMNELHLLGLKIGGNIYLQELIGMRISIVFLEIQLLNDYVIENERQRRVNLLNIARGVKYRFMIIE